MTLNTSDGRKCSLIILSITITFILIIVIVGVCVRFLIEGNLQRIILIVLICVLLTVGMTGLIILGLRSRRLKKKPKKTNTNNNTSSVKYKEVEPSAPPMTTPSSWNFSKDYSNRTTIQA